MNETKHSPREEGGAPPQRSGMEGETVLEVSSSITRAVMTPQLLEALTSESGKPRLKVARYMLLNEENRRDLGFEDLEDALKLGEELFCYWRDLAEYLLLHAQYVGHGESVHKNCFLAVKCSKRGNDVYQRRIKNRFEWLNNSMPDKQIFKMRDFQVKKVVKTSLLWITLTWDRKRGDLIHAWETLGEDFNRFISALRRKYGKISSLRVWESYASGYPHVHAIILFEEARFTVFPHWSEKDENLTFRINEKSEIAELWHSHVDIQAISSLRAVFTYIKKHQEKVILGLSGSIQEREDPRDPKVGFDLENVKGLRTLFLCWIFRKRSFSVSGDFRERIHDLIRAMHNSNMVGQLDLEGNLIREWVYVFLGVFSGAELGIPSCIWVKELSLDEVAGFLDRRKW